jgi:hypothetical protein
MYVDVVYTVVRFLSLYVFSFSLAFFFFRFIPASLFLLPLYPYLLIPLFPYLLIPLYPYLLIPLFPYLLIPLFPYLLIPLFPYLLIPLFPFRRKRWAGIGKKIDWGSYREITTCPSILSPSFYLSLYLPLFLIRFFKILDKEKSIEDGFVFILLIVRDGRAALRFACK